MKTKTNLKKTMSRPSIKGRRFSVEKVLCSTNCWAICLAMFFAFCPQTLLGQIHNEKPLELSGYSLSEAYDIQDGTKLDLDDPLILKLIYRVKKTSPKSRLQYSRYSKDVTWEQLNANTQDYRLWVFDRNVRLKNITKHRFATAEKGETVTGVYVCHCVNEHQQPLIVLSRSVPSALPIDTSLDEPINLTGFLLACRLTTNDIQEISSVEKGNESNAENQSSNSTEANPQVKASSAEDSEPRTKGSPVFIVDRIAWYPDQVVEQRSNRSHVALAQAGMDIGLLDLVRKNNTRKLGLGDSEAFFQMIGAANRLVKEPELDNRIGFIDMMTDAKSNFGNGSRIKGVVRSCSKVNISNADVANRIGVSKYFQLMVFPNLDGRTIKVKNKKGDDLEYSRFPITVCCLQLPDGLSPTDVERKPFLIDGFFFRFWKYQSDKTDAAGAPGQVSPLIIAKTLIPIKSQEGRLNFFLLSFVSALIAGFTLMVWWYRSVDRNRQSPGQKIIDSLPEQLDVSGIEQ